MGSNSSDIHSKKYTHSLHITYGISIIILAIVVSGMVCLLGGVQVPYFSNLFAPIVPPNNLYYRHIKAGTSTEFVTGKSAMSTSTSTTTP